MWKAALGVAKMAQNAQARQAKSPFYNDDDPTPRRSPDDEMAKLRAAAAAGAGTPGFLTKQQQQQPPTETPSESESVTEASAVSAATAVAACSGGGSSSSSSSSSSSTADGKRPAGVARSPGGASCDVHTGAVYSDASAYCSDSPSSSTDEMALGSLPRPSDHDKGIFQGFLSIFQFERHREKVSGKPSELLRRLSDLGPAQDLPRPPRVWAEGNAPSDGSVDGDYSARGDGDHSARGEGRLMRRSRSSRASEEGSDDGSFRDREHRKSRSGREGPTGGSSGSVPDGEAVPVIKALGEAAPRPPAQERVFGTKGPGGSKRADSMEPDRESSSRRSSVFSNSGIFSDRGSPSRDEMELVKRRYEAACSAFDRENEEWYALQRSSTVPYAYRGAKPKSPPTPACLDAMRKSFTKAEPQPLHQKYLLDLLLAVKRAWECPPPNWADRMQVSKPVIDIEEPPDGARLIIIGDTHGQLADVLWIFAEYGPPSRSNIYLFNGDVADRGSHAVEIFALLFGYMLAEPGSVYMSRGNHENREINERAQHYGGGFGEEVRNKYNDHYMLGGDGARLFEIFTGLFELLPLAFVVAEKLLVIHGGLWRHRGVTLSQLRKLNNRKQCPESPQTYDDYIFFDLLWSDPHPEDGDGVHESTRGDGCILFGRDMTSEFLRRNSLQLIVRSHQLPSDGHGYEVLHDGRCITVFSASNYGGSCYNAGALLVWRQGEIDAHEFIAPNLQAQQKALEDGNYDALLRRFSSRGPEWEDEVGCPAEPPHVARIDSRMVVTIKQRICRHRHALLAEFTKADRTNKGRLDVAVWGECLQRTLELGSNVPWAKYQPWLADLSPESGDIEYAAFLGRYRVRLKEQYSGWARTVLQTFYNSLLAADLQISELLSFFDHDGDGHVSIAECTKALGSLDLGLSPEQIRQLLPLLGLDERGADVDLERFFKRLALVADHTVIARSQQELADLRQIAQWLDGVCKRERKSLPSLFMSWDDNNNGYLDYDEFVRCCIATQEKLYNKDPGAFSYVYTRDELEELARTVDQAKTGRINYLSWLGLFAAAETTPGLSPLVARMSPDSTFTEAVCATIWTHETTLLRALRTHDPRHTGTVSPAHFRASLETMNDSISPPSVPIPHAQLGELILTLPLNAEAMINYKEFLAAFEVRDALKDHLKDA
jgi:protein phosphatase